MKSLGKRIGLCLLMLIMTAAQAGLAGTGQNVAEAADKELAQKPYMGWSSFSMQVYEPSGNWISADSIKKQSDAMHEKLTAIRQSLDSPSSPPTARIAPGRRPAGAAGPRVPWRP
ncbi:hypothetical protein HQN87_30560 [Paenibacillus tritici]|uniref:Uncharacterized protein n=1 Tax=Paenibacillus tritici TaxID=1873425 RepID=A0ABX2DY37_9BACL|nr:hypothetical protein [Paenibacillus tritici]NQX49646.1 hypothetical protein [Paenibacillus tritici]